MPVSGKLVSLSTLAHLIIQLQREEDFSNSVSTLKYTHKNIHNYNFKGDNDFKMIRHDILSKEVERNNFLNVRQQAMKTPYYDRI